MSAASAVQPGYQFASDNTSGVCPEAWQSLVEANDGYAAGYGDDPWTERASNLLRELFETDCEVFFVFNGTAANSLALSALCQSYHSLICADVAHVETDECGAPEFFSNGTKLLLARHVCGKVLPESVVDIVGRRTDIHYPKPRVLSLTQATETGTVYSVDEVTELCRTAHELGLKVHMDGARFANAIAALGVSPKDVTWRAGVDVLCFGGTKNGLPIGDVVIFFNRQLGEEFDYRCKQAGQLASKMRYLSAPWVGILETDAWLTHARHANEAAASLESRLTRIRGVEMLFPRQANSVFLKLPPAWLKQLRDKGWRFYTFIGSGGARFMCSWRTTDAEIGALVSDIQSLTVDR
jgi:threonine aldolase